MWRALANAITNSVRVFGDYHKLRKIFPTKCLFPHPCNRIFVIDTFIPIHESLLLQYPQTLPKIVLQYFGPSTSFHRLVSMFYLTLENSIAVGILESFWMYRVSPRMTLNVCGSVCILSSTTQNKCDVECFLCFCNRRILLCAVFAFWFKVNSYVLLLAQQTLHNPLC